MQRRVEIPRPHYVEAIRNDGLLWHENYWLENASYEFSMSEILKLEQTTGDLQQMCLAAVQRVIDRNEFSRLGISPTVANTIRWAWEAEPPALYGRMDLAYRGDGSPAKLLEYNADTPTGLVEAAVAQWNWKTEKYPARDQWNSLHEKLVAKWTSLREWVDLDTPIYFAGINDELREDHMTLAYLQETAVQAGYDTRHILMEGIGWNGQEFVDRDDAPIRTIFKLYPWEWMCAESFAEMVLRDRATQWIEPIWKMVLSNKGILAILWEMYPGHPNLLPTYLEAKTPSHVVKPLLSREGQNVTIIKDGQVLEGTDGLYGNAPCVYQEYYELPEFGGRFPVLGSWMIDQDPAGMGIRESESRITGNTSQFIPHTIQG